MQNKICTLIPHFNNLEGLKLSISSIQEEITVDVLIVDDGSEIRPKLHDFEYGFGDLKIIELPKNVGLALALNAGLEFIRSKKYKYIGRLDAGDTCIKNRFTKQVNYLEENEDTYLLGSWVNVVDENFNFKYVLKHPTDYETIKKKMYFNLTFMHPAICFRSEIIEEVGDYPTKFFTEDYAFIFNIVKKRKSENLPEPLINYVIDPTSVSSQKRLKQVWNRIRVIKSHFYLGYYPIVGLLRNFLLLFISRNLSEKLKSLLRR